MSTTIDSSAPRLKAVFSDLDGTLVHFPAWFEEHGSKIVSIDEPSGRAVLESPTGERRDCRLLPSSTMGHGLVSERTVELVDTLRAEGILFVVVTAARKSTLFERWPLLPDCDARVCETGSRVYLGDELDHTFSTRFEHITGPLDRELEVALRPEPLWQFFRSLEAVPNLKRDSRSYYGCFRVDTKDDAATDAALRAHIAAQLPEGVDCESRSRSIPRPLGHPPFEQPCTTCRPREAPLTPLDWSGCWPREGRF